MAATSVGQQSRVWSCGTLADGLEQIVSAAKTPEEEERILEEMMKDTSLGYQA